MNFSGGYTSLTQFTADEKVGKLMLLLVLIRATPLGYQILKERCDPKFDEKRAGARTTFQKKSRQQEHPGQQEARPEQRQGPQQQVPVPPLDAKEYTGSPDQIEKVDRQLGEHQLGFCQAWMHCMSTQHREALRKVVHEKTYNIRQPVSIPPVVADRRKLQSDPPMSPYYESNHQHHQEEPQEPQAKYSLDCSIDELSSLLELMLAFHAAYKYGVDFDCKRFQQQTRQMMLWIKQWVRRDPGTKNWSISKFHELLHIAIDIRNIGAPSNVDAGKGESGLRYWAKLPAKTVRSRGDDHFLKDMSYRLYETRLLQLAFDRCLDDVVHEEEEEPAAPTDEEIDAEIMCGPDQTYRVGLGLAIRVERRIRRHFEQMFPAWSHVETPWFWSRLLCLSRNLIGNDSAKR